MSPQPETQHVPIPRATTAACDVTAAHRQNTLRILHAFDIFGRSFKADKNHLLLVLSFFHRVLRRKYDGARRRAGRSRNTLADHVGLVRRFQIFRVERGVQQHVERLRVDLHQRFLLGNHALVDEVARNLDSGSRRTLAVTRLKHVQFLVLHGEFHILHIAVMVFENLANFLELLVHFGEYFRHLRDGHRGTHAGNNVLALSVR